MNGTMTSNLGRKVRIEFIQDEYDGVLDKTIAEVRITEVVFTPAQTDMFTDPSATYNVGDTFWCDPANVQWDKYRYRIFYTDPRFVDVEATSEEDARRMFDEDDFDPNTSQMDSDCGLDITLIANMDKEEDSNATITL